VEDGDGVLIARIANEGRANALDAAILDEIVSLLHGPRAAGARAVLLAGAGERHFSSGLDLGERTPEARAAELQDGARRLGNAAQAIASSPGPVIGDINGAAVGGALELAIACDWRIARRGARLGMPAARIGVVYAADGLRRFVAAMGPARTRRLFLTTAPVEAEEAYDLGLVDQVVEADDLWQTARAAATAVAQAAPLAVAGTRAIVAALSEGPESIQETAQAARARAFGSEDFREGLAAFREKRPPRFEGR
jgi:enoyl-CoA hydratase/carnithine racemase